jgi:hypothetical protein
MLPLRVLLATMVLALTIGASPARLAAQAAEHDAPEAAGTEGEEWRERPNHLAGFLGVTANADESAFTLGLDYTRRVAPGVSVGVFTDYVLGELREFIVGPMVWLYLVGNVAVELAPAAERADEEWAFVGRVGVAYEIEFGGFIAGPYAAVDLVEGRKALYVLGVAAGIPF